MTTIDFVKVCEDKQRRIKEEHLKYGELHNISQRRILSSRVRSARMIYDCKNCTEKIVLGDEYLHEHCMDKNQGWIEWSHYPRCSTYTEDRAVKQIEA